MIPPISTSTISVVHSAAAHGFFLRGPYLARDTANASPKRSSLGISGNMVGLARRAKRRIANASHPHHIRPMRLALKTGSYSLMHFAVAIAVTFAITRDWRAALAVGLIEPIVQTLAYVVHERVWARLERKTRTA